MRIFSKILAGLLFGAIAAIVISPLAAVLVEAGYSNIVFFVTFLIVLAAALFAPTGRRAWGRGSLICGLLLLALPLSTIVLSGQVTSDMISASADDSGATAAGAVIGSGLMVGASAFIGFILGAIFVILGLVLVLGGTRDVRVVK